MTNNYTYTVSVNTVASGCTCNMPWNSILPPPPCPVHSQAQNLKPMMGMPTPPVQPWSGIPPEYWDYDWYFDELDEVSNEEAINGLLEIVEDLDEKA